MPLYDVTNKDKMVDPKTLEDSEYIKTATKKMAKVTFAKLIRTADTALDNLKPTQSTALVWTKAGALFGHKCTGPVNDINHLWEKSNEVFDGVELLKFIGTLLMWRISLRDETWLLYRFNTGEVDPVTGKEIKINQYWIDENYEEPKELGVDDLIKKFNKHGK